MIPNYTLTELPHTQFSIPASIQRLQNAKTKTISILGDKNGPISNHTGSEPFLQ